MDTAFFVASKLLGPLLGAGTWIILAVGLGFLAVVTGRRRAAAWLGGLAFTALLAIAVLPLGDLLLQPLEAHYPADPPLSKVDGIIVLGGGIDPRASAHWGQLQLNEAAERYTAAMALARRFPAARVIFTGGSGALRDVAGDGRPEAPWAQAFFTEQGLAPGRLVIEGTSRNTAENASLSLALAAPRTGEVWVLVTSASHMPRAIASFDRAGWPPLVPYPVDFRSSAFADGIGLDLAGHLRSLDMALREAAGQLAYRLAGR